jgi:membrane-associated protease RseP (regulator of RpoE activity)
VDASLPYFLPFPLGPIGTMGAVIGMRDPVRQRAALLDIGAAGPLAGLVVALPVLIYGVATSEVLPIGPGEHLREGHSLLYEGVLYLLKGPIAPGHDIMLNATAFAGWAGLLVTMMNLVPAGQLDGGHVAYALFGPVQDRFSKRVAQLLIAFGACMLGYGAWEGRASANLWENVSASGSWLIWAGVISVISRVFGSAHPPTDATTLSPVRRALGWLCLVLFVLLFMPRWLVPGL